MGRDRKAPTFHVSRNVGVCKVFWRKRYGKRPLESCSKTTVFLIVVESIFQFRSSIKQLNQAKETHISDSLACALICKRKIYTVPFFSRLDSSKIPVALRKQNIACANKSNQRKRRKLQIYFVKLLCSSRIKNAAQPNL